MNAENPTFQALENQAAFLRHRQQMSWNYTYHIDGEVDGQETQAFILTIEQGSDFNAMLLTGSCFSYDTENATDFPIPGNTDWAGRGLSLQLTDTKTGRTLTSGFVPAECILTPGYGLNFQQPFPFRYFFLANTKLKVEVKNRDDEYRTHTFSIDVNGYKILSS